MFYIFGIYISIPGINYHLQYAVLTSKNLPEGVDVTKLEEYLSTEEFESLFKMTREEFKKLQPWRRDELKKKLNLF